MSERHAGSQNDTSVVSFANSPDYERRNNYYSHKETGMPAGKYKWDGMNQT